MKNNRRIRINKMKTTVFHISEDQAKSEMSGRWKEVKIISTINLQPDYVI